MTPDVETPTDPVHCEDGRTHKWELRDGSVGCSMCGGHDGYLCPLCWDLVDEYDDPDLFKQIKETL